jgi:hypothetical protein
MYFSSNARLVKRDILYETHHVDAGNGKDQMIGNRIQTAGDYKHMVYVY